MSSNTRLSLLGRLRAEGPDHPSAWSEFVKHYGEKIAAWCRRWGLQGADSDDITQAVLVKLAIKMRSFVYQPGGSFRAWLKTLTRHAWSDFIAERKRSGSRIVGSDELLESVAACDDLEARLADAFDQEALEIAVTRVRERITEQTWEAFRLTAMEGLSGTEVAGRLAMPVANVYKAKSNVQKLLQDEVRKLDQEE